MSTSRPRAGTSSTTDRLRDAHSFDQLRRGPHGSGYESSSAGDSASIQTDYDPFAPPTRPKAFSAYPLHASYQSVSSLERVIGLERPISPGTMPPRAQTTTPDADGRQRRLRMEAYATQPGFPYRSSAHLIDSGHRASGSGSSANSSDEVDLDLSLDLVAAGIAPPWPSSRADEAAGRPRSRSAGDVLPPGHVFADQAPVPVAGYAYNTTERVDAPTHETPGIRQRRGSGPLRVFLDRALAGLPSPPWSAATAMPPSWPAHRRNSHDVEDSPQTATTVSPRTPMDRFSSNPAFSPPMSPPVSEHDPKSPTEAVRSSRIGLGSIFRRGRETSQHGLGMHIPQVEVIAPNDDYGLEPSAPIRSHSPAPSSGRASPTPASPLISPASSPPQPDSPHVHFTRSSPDAGHGKPSRSLFQDEAPAIEGKGKAVERKRMSAYKPLRLVEEVENRSARTTPAQSRNASANQADTSGSTSGAFTMSTTLRSASDTSALMRKLAAQTAEVAAWPGARTLDDTATPPLPAKTLFLAGFVLGPWCWLLGGWLMRTDGELFGTRGAHCRCDRTALHDHTLSVSLTIDHENATTRPLCAAEQLRRLRLTGAPITGQGLDHDVQYYNSPHVSRSPAPIDPFVKACRYASIASGVAIAGAVSAAIYFAAV